MRGYPIGSFLFWDVNRENIDKFQFYEFIRDYHQRDNFHNQKANITGSEDITVVLDGQQRLTALSISMKGFHASKIPWKRWQSDDAFPRKRLYLNLLSKSKDSGLLYGFNFLTKKEAETKDQGVFWFQVGDVLKFSDLKDIFNYLRENSLIESQCAQDRLCKLFEVISQKGVINYYLERSQEIEKVLNIFIRVNSGGTELSYSDLLLSIATAQWKTMDAREEIHNFVDEINRLGDGYFFPKDFVLKSCLVLADISNIAFKVDNFNKANMGKIEEEWEKIKKSIRISIELISSYGYNSQSLTSANAIIPIANYILKIDNPDNFVLSSAYREDREKIRKWFAISLLKRVFSGQPDNVLRPIRGIIKNKTSFPFDQIIEKFKGTNKSILFPEDDIENLLSLKYGRAYTFSVLALLYPNLDFRNKFHQDHIFPKSYFTYKKLNKMGIKDDDILFYLENYNFIANLQLLEGVPNAEKNKKYFKQWLDETFPDEEEKKLYMTRNYIPQNISLDFNNFKEFFKEREKLIAKKLKEILM